MRRRAFTLMEVIVVCAIIAMFSALVLPNVVAMKASRERDAAYASVLDLTQKGREAAIQRGRTFTLRLEDNGARVVLEEEEETGALVATPLDGEIRETGNGRQRSLGTAVGGVGDPSQNTTGGSADSASGGGSVTLPQGVTLGEVMLEGKPSSASDFALHFYPDGRSEGGGFEMVDRGSTRSVSVSTRGLASLLAGSLPQTGESRWEAGQYEQRAAS